MTLVTRLDAVGKPNPGSITFNVYDVNGSTLTALSNPQTVTQADFQTNQAMMTKEFTFDIDKSKLTGGDIDILYDVPGFSFPVGVGSGYAYWIGVKPVPPTPGQPPLTPYYFVTLVNKAGGPHVGSFYSGYQAHFNGAQYPFGYSNGLVSDFSFYPGFNDKAGGALIWARAGMRLFFFRHGNGSLAGGFCEVFIKNQVVSYYLDSFERNYDDNYISVRYWNSQDLDGEISGLRVEYTP